MKELHIDTVAAEEIQTPADIARMHPKLTGDSIMLDSVQDDLAQQETLFALAQPII